MWIACLRLLRDHAADGGIGPRLAQFGIALDLALHRRVPHELLREVQQLARPRVRRRGAAVVHARMAGCLPVRRVTGGRARRLRVTRMTSGRGVSSMPATRVARLRVAGVRARRGACLTARRSVSCMATSRAARLRMTSVTGRTSASGGLMSRVRGPGSGLPARGRVARVGVAGRLSARGVVHPGVVRRG